MRFQRGIRFGIAALALAAVTGWVFGEIAVELDDKGKYRHVVILQGMEGQEPIVWRQVRSDSDPMLVLNPRGDEVGDLTPSVREHPGTGMPWAVWSLNDGTDYEIAYSVFNGRQWVVTRRVEEGDNPHHDLDPVLEFTRGGVGVVAWWRATPVPQVFLSYQVRGAWSPAIAISDPEVDSRHPRLQVRGKDLVVTYETQVGTDSISLSGSRFERTSGATEECNPEISPDCDISDGPDIDGVTDPYKRRRKKE
jgi:hypothetical protein